MIKLVKNKIQPIYYILALAVGMRLPIINQSLWLDEAIGALAVRDYSYSGIVTNFLKFDNHPPLFYLDLKSWTSVFGYSEVSLRLPSVIYGVFTVYLAYLIAQKLSQGKNSFFPILSAFLLATSQFHIYYSQESRMYSLVAFLASLAIYSFLFLIDDRLSTRFRTWYFVLFSFSITTLVFTDYVPVFLLTVFWIVSLVGKKDKRWWKKFIIAHIPLLLLGILWMPTFLIQAGKGKWLIAKLPAWQQVAGGATFKQAALVWIKFVFGRISLLNKKLYYILVVIASAPFVVALFNSFKEKEKKLNIIWLWLLFPLVFGFFVSFWFPAFIYFRFLYVIPAFYVVIAWGVSKYKSVKVRNLVTIFLLVVNITGWLIYVFDSHQQRENWRGAVEFIENSLKENEIVLFEYPNPFSPYRWYMKNGQAYGATNSISASESETKQRTKELTQDVKGIYYFEYLRDLSDPKGYVLATIGDEGFVSERSYDFEGVGLVSYYIKK